LLARPTDCCHESWDRGQTPAGYAHDGASRPAIVPLDVEDVATWLACGRGSVRHPDILGSALVLGEGTEASLSHIEAVVIACRSRGGSNALQRWRGQVPSLHRLGNAPVGQLLERIQQHDRDLDPRVDLE
jgi:hypothetical protein